MGKLLITALSPLHNLYQSFFVSVGFFHVTKHKWLKTHPSIGFPSDRDQQRHRNKELSYRLWNGKRAKPEKPEYTPKYLISKQLENIFRVNVYYSQRSKFVSFFPHTKQNKRVTTILHFCLFQETLLLWSRRQKRQERTVLPNKQ